ncbi:Cell cycle checkpoint protein RAD17 [Taenia crassiceps]|uniref:Cell cycle checkpoint protein RAD17 n=1 Tax=Taenia crassiceps TaxID=6207 RepID=A0ABR4QEL0_9CEST
MAAGKIFLKKQKSAAEKWYSGLTLQCTSVSRTFSEIWSDLYAPISTEELAVHHGKIREVTEVCMAAKTKNTCVVVLTGPPGCSKSTCLLTVCRTLGFPAPLIWAERDWEGGDASLNDLQQFEEFLFKSTRYHCPGDVLKADFSFSTSKQQLKAPRVVLIESLPPGFSDSPFLFHKCIRSVLSDILVPTLLAFVFTKSPSINNFGNPVTCNFDNATLNRLFPECIKQEFGINVIEFNPVAPLIMSKALSRIAELVSNEMGIPTPPKSFLQRLAASSSGDIRLAINNLQFALMAKPRSGKKFRLDSGLCERDSGLPVFHALGKILYAKRLNDPTPCSESFLPPHLQSWKRAPLSFNPESVLDHSGLAGDDVVAWLHENYLAFHDTPESFGALEWISSQVGWADAYLSGGMNWRLGLAPAADRNSLPSTNSACAAGSHYTAMVVTRAIAIWPLLKMVGATGSKFRPLKAPQSKLVETWQRNSLESLRASCELSADMHLVKEVLIGGLTGSLLDRLPLEFTILGSRMLGDIELLSSICRFQGVGGTTEHNFCAVKRGIGAGCVWTTGPCHLYDAVTDADAEVVIDENFSDEECPPSSP